MSSLAEVMRAVKTAVETFNNWLMGDMELVIDSIRDGIIKALVKQNCACSLDFSLKEELEKRLQRGGARDGGRGPRLGRGERRLQSRDKTEKPRLTN